MTSARRPPTTSRDAFTRDLDLPRGPTRERVRIDAHGIRAARLEVRTLATVGAFRVVPMRGTASARGRASDVLRKDLEHLRELGLVRTMPYVVGRERTTLVTLTERGRARARSVPVARATTSRQQAFYAGIAKPRELAHDVARSSRLPRRRRAPDRRWRRASAASCWSTS